MSSFSQFCIAACGSAYHVGVVSQYVLEDLAGIPVRVELSSEFRYRRMPMDSSTLVLVISQSGGDGRQPCSPAGSVQPRPEDPCRGQRGRFLHLPRSGSCLYTKAGPEIAVAAIKAYSAQQMAMYLFAIRLGQMRGTLSDPAPYLSKPEALLKKSSDCLRKRNGCNGSPPSSLIPGTYFISDEGWIMPCALRGV